MLCFINQKNYSSSRSHFIDKMIENIHIPVYLVSLVSCVLMYTIKTGCVMHFDPYFSINSSEVTPTWFYELPYTSLKRYDDRIDKKWLKYVLLTKGYFRLIANVDPTCSIKSIVYVGTFNNVNLGYYTTLGNRLIKFHTKQYLPSKPMQIVGNFDIGVYYVQHFWQWGHLIHDFATSMLYLPRDLCKKHFVILPTPVGYDITNEWLKFLGFNATLFQMKREHQVFVKTLYFVTGGHWAHSVTIGGLPKVRSYVHQKLHLTNIKPRKFCAFNRNTRWKTIKDFGLLCHTLRKQVKIDEGQEWICGVPQVSTIEESAKEWQDIKVLVAPCGSQVYNTIYMQEKTGLLLFYSKNDQPNTMLCLTFKLYMLGISFPYPANEQFMFELDLPTVVANVQRLIYVVNNGRWPTIVSTRPAFVSGKDYIDDEPLNFTMKSEGKSPEIRI